jgi:hypothetical protein
MARRNPQWLVMFVTGRTLPARALGRRLSAVDIRPGTGGKASSVQPVDRARIVSDLERDGYCTGLVLEDSTRRRLLDLAAESTCFANGDRELPFVARPGQLPVNVGGVAVTVGEYLGVEESPVVQDLLGDEVLLEIASRYLRGDPHLVEARFWWSLGAPAARPADDLVRFGQERFHYDLDDWRCVNFFFYLTDVDEESGPHTVVRSSHRRRRLRDQLSPFKGTTEAALRRFYGDDAIVEIVGMAGSGFVSDPFAFHMGRAPRRDRLMCKLELGCGPRGRGPGLAAVHQGRRSL